MLALAGIVVLSPDGLLIRLVTADPWTLLFWRGLLIGLSLFAVLLARFGRLTWPTFQSAGKKGLLAAGAQAMGTIFFVLAITHTTVANTLIILGVTPLWSALYSHFFLRERIYLRTILAIPAALLGIFGNTHWEVETNSGDLYAICGSLFISAQSVIVRSARPMDLSPSLVVGGLATALVALPVAHPFAVTTSDAVFLGLLGLVVMPVYYAMIIAALRYIPAPEVNLIMLLEIALGSYWVWFFTGEQPTVHAFLGGALVILTLAAHTAFSLRDTRSG